MSHTDTTRPPVIKNVCIIGGGVSGLSLAYYLMQLKRPEDQITFTIFEKEDICGGQCTTYNVVTDDASGKARWGG